MPPDALTEAEAPAAGKAGDGLDLLLRYGALQFEPASPFVNPFDADSPGSAACLEGAIAGWRQEGRNLPPMRIETCRAAFAAMGVHTILITRGRTGSGVPMQLAWPLPHASRRHIADLVRIAGWQFELGLCIPVELWRRDECGRPDFREVLPLLLLHADAVEPHDWDSDALGDHTVVVMEPENSNWSSGDALGEWMCALIDGSGCTGCDGRIVHRFAEPIRGTASTGDLGSAVARAKSGAYRAWRGAKGGNC